MIQKIRRIFSPDNIYTNTLISFLENNIFSFLFRLLFVFKFIHHFARTIIQSPPKPRRRKILFFFLSAECHIIVVRSYHLLVSRVCVLFNSIYIPVCVCRISQPISRHLPRPHTCTHLKRFYRAANRIRTYNVIEKRRSI